MAKTQNSNSEKTQIIFFLTKPNYLNWTKLNKKIFKKHSIADFNVFW